jgi:hypothetical protein
MLIKYYIIVGTSVKKWKEVGNDINTCIEIN